MSNVSSSISTPGEARQTRRIVLACDLAFLNQMIALTAILLPTVLLVFNRFLPSYALQLLVGRVGLATLAWLMMTASLLGIGAALLLLGAPRHMRCFIESSIYAGLVTAHTLVTVVSSFINPPAYVHAINQFGALVITPIAYLLVLRKIALFLDSPADIRQTYYCFRMMMIGIGLIVIGQAIARFSTQLLQPFNALLIMIALFVSGISAIALVGMRLFSLNLSIRRQLRSKLELYLHRCRSDNDSSLLAADSQTSAATATIGLGRFAAWGLAVVLVFVGCEAMLYRQRSIELDRLRSEQQAEARLKEESHLANQFNNELWERVRTPQAELKQDDIMKMGAICKKFPSAAYYNTLGVAHYRSGNYDAAEQFLKISATWREGVSKARGGGADLGSIAFLAMCNHKLGRPQKANTYREQFESLMQQDKYGRDKDYQAFQEEIRVLFEVK